MKTTRRQFVIGSVAASALACRGGGDTGAGAVDTALVPLEPAPDRDPEPAAWQPAEPLDLEAFPWGVQVGDVIADGALVHVWAVDGAVDLVVVRGVDDGWEEVERQVALPVVDGSVNVTLAGLDADTVYALTFLRGDGSGRSHVARLRTALGDGGYRKLVFGATSCLGYFDSEWGSLRHLAASNLDFALLLGDTVYADGSQTVEDYRAEYQWAFGAGSLQELAASTSIVATWDDHEVDNNWRTIPGDGEEIVTPELVAAATTAFREALPQRVGPGGTGIWRKLSWGSVLDVFVLDCRGERDYVTEIISPDQLAWVIDGLRSSEATFKLVLSSVHLTDHYRLFSIVEADDRWQGFPDQRVELVEVLDEVPGCLVITGDMHYGAVQRLGQPEEPGHDTFEVAAGPAGSEPIPVLGIAEFADPNAEQYPILLEANTSCRFTADPGMKTITVEFVDGAGATVAEQVFDFS